MLHVDTCSTIRNGQSGAKFRYSQKTTPRLKIRVNQRGREPRVVRVSRGEGAGTGFWGRIRALETKKRECGGEAGGRRKSLRLRAFARGAPMVVFVN